MKISRLVRNQKGKSEGLIHTIYYRLDYFFNSLAQAQTLRIWPSTILVILILIPQTISSAEHLIQPSKSTHEPVLTTNPFDTDGDGVLNNEEVNLYHTNPSNSDSDGDGSSDGIEIETETDPLNNSSRPLYSRTISFNSVVQEAFNLKQSVYDDPYPDIQAIPMLDENPDPGFVGLTFQESNAISSTNLIDQLQWYAFARPRAALDKLRFRVYIDNNNDGIYDLKTYSDANPNYSSLVIQPPINTQLLPIAGKVLSRFVIGHAQPGMGYPQFFDINANGYGRFNGYAPQTVGASYRVALHNVFIDEFGSGKEDFPRFREIYFKIPNTYESNLIGLVDSEGFTGAVNMNLRPGEESTMQVSAKFFPRRNILISNEPHTGLVGFSSMFLSDEDNTPENSTDEAHDSDLLVVGYDRDGNGIIDIIVEREIDNPPDFTVTDFSTLQTGKQLYFALENRDRNASHYSSYASAKYETRSSYSVQLISSNIPLSTILYERPTAVEYDDNIVVNLAIKQNLPEATSVNNAVVVEYITKAYFPDDSDKDGLTNQLERLVGIDVNDSDTDDDGGSDYLELLAGTDPCSGCVDIDVLIGGSNLGRYGLLPGKSIFDRYRISNGPVKVESTNGQPIFTSQRAIFGQSFNSIVGYPADQLTTEYWFTSYDDKGMITYLVIGNPDASQTAEVDVYIGGVLQRHFSIPPGQRVFPRFGINGGPVRVVSTNGVNIFTSERTRFGNSFNEVMGYPANRFATEYWFTSYDDVGMATFVVIGNPHTSQTAEVDVFISGNLKRHYSIAPGQRVFPRYGINGGPVRVVSTNNVDIFASERTRFGNTFNEVMGYPADQAHTEFWFTSYDDRGMLTYLIIGNPSTSQTANVDVYIGGVKRNTSPIQIAPGQRFFQRYNINAGPVHIVSTNGVNVFASERSRYLQSFNEVLGIADNQLTTDYWYTSYDDVGMTTYLVVASP